MTSYVHLPPKDLLCFRGRWLNFRGCTCGWYTPDAWGKEGATKVGYEISFTRQFDKPQPLCKLEEIRADIIAAEQEAEGVLDVLLKGGGA